MKKSRLKTRQKQHMSFRMRIIIGTSIFLAASCILIIVFHIGDVKDSNAAAKGAYRAVASGNWEDAANWEVYDGSTWNPADEAPVEELPEVIVSTGQNLVLTEEISVSSIVVETGAHLDIDCNSIKIVKSGGGGINVQGELSLGNAIVEGDGDFIVAKNAVLFIGSDFGIDKKAASGNIQTKGKRDLNKDAVYVFNGNISQHTGNGLPPVMNKLVIDNSSGVELDQNITLTGTLALKKGVLNCGRFILTLGMSPTSLASIRNEGGALQGRFKCWYGQDNVDSLNFSLSDGTSIKNFKFLSDVMAYKKGMIELIYKPGIPDDSKKSPYEARHVVVGLFPDGYYSVSLSNGADEAWLKFVSSKYISTHVERITWNISSRDVKDIIPTSATKQNPDHNFSNLITGPNPFNKFLVIRFHSESGGIAHLSMVNSSGKVIYNEKVNAVEGYNQVLIESIQEHAGGDYMVQLSNISEIQTAKATKMIVSL